MTIKTIIVDDEKLAIQGLQLRLEPYEDVEIIDTCSNGREAIRKIKTLRPDLVFLDIQMPGFDGFSVVQGVMEIDPPLFVFVTAYQEHAIRAFQANALHYLMKPVDEDKLADVIERVRQRLNEKRGADEAEKLLGVPIVGAISTTDGPPIPNRGSARVRLVRGATLTAELTVAAFFLAFVVSAMLDSQFAVQFAQDPLAAFSQVMHQLGEQTL